jgi:hypothetical protein
VVALTVLTSASVGERSKSKALIQTKKPAEAGFFLLKHLLQSISVDRAARVTVPLGQGFLQKIFHDAVLWLTANPQA